MKNTSLMLAFLLLFSIFSITFVSAESPQNILLETIFNKLSEIKDILSSMLSKLEQIEAKNTSVNVNVEPNITITPSEVNVEINPNITLPEKVCLWESYSQTNKFDIIHGGESTSSTSLYMSVPQNKLFKEINITKSIVKARNCGQITIKVNDIECLNTGGGTNIFFSDLCPERFKGGLNKIEFIGHGLGNPYNCNAELNDIYLEMEVKPNNC